MKKKWFWILVAVAVAAATIAIWQRKFSPTKVAFVNYQITTLGQIAKSNDNNYIKISEVDLDDLKKLRHFDVVMVNGMGLRITEEQRAQLQAVADKSSNILPIVSMPLL
ncbi:MAG: hypothetical protein IJ622_07565 [Bacteroidales bacterium]|nr:hypothetical protein [Bacteroidales bacterium]